MIRPLPRKDKWSAKLARYNYDQLVKHEWHHEIEALPREIIFIHLCLVIWRWGKVKGHIELCKSVVSYLWEERERALRLSAQNAPVMKRECPVPPPLRWLTVDHYRSDIEHKIRESLLEWPMHKYRAILQGKREIGVTQAVRCKEGWMCVGVARYAAERWQITYYFITDVQWNNLVEEKLAQDGEL